MEINELEDIYQIDEKRLLDYYERIKHQKIIISDIQATSKFLINQSIGTSHNEVLDVLNYYFSRLSPDKNLRDLALEWIRANKIRLEYKKYLIRTQYPKDNYSLAIDDCIFVFFIKYDSYLRSIFSRSIEEYEIASLYEIFFSPFERKTLDLTQILNKYKELVPTIHSQNEKIQTNLHTLRFGLSEIILYDYKAVLSSRENEKKQKTVKFETQNECKQNESCEFNGSGIERMIKTYCINKQEISLNTIQNAVNQLLSSFFRLGKFYNFDEFKDLLENCIVEYLSSGLTSDLKNNFSLDELTLRIDEHFTYFRKIHRIKVLDGMAWITDLKPVITSFLTITLDNLFNEDNKKFDRKIQSSPIINQEPLTSDLDKVDFSKTFDLNLEIEDYRYRLEKELIDSNIGIVQRRNIIRQKIQEFKQMKRKELLL